MNLLNIEKTKTVAFDGLTFTIKAVMPKERLFALQRRANFQGGHPVTSFTDVDFSFFEDVALCDTCIDKYPKELENKGSALNWDNAELISFLAKEIREYTATIETELKKNRPSIGIGEG